MRTWPVMKLDASDARNRTGPTISSGDAARRRKPACAIASCISGVFARTMSVSTVPGASAFTRMPRRAKSAAIARVNDIRPGLAGCVHRDVRREEERAGRDHVHDGGVLARLQVRQRLLHEEDRAAQVHVERLLPRLGRELPEWLRQRVRRVVDDDVDAAEAVDRLRHEIVQRLEVAGVGRHTQRVAAHGAQVRLGLARTRRPCGWRPRPWRPRSTKPSATARPMPRVPPVTIATRPVRSNSDCNAA